MRVRLTDGPDGDVYLESPYKEWNPVREQFKAAIPWQGRSWDDSAKKWLIRALYVADLLAFLTQHGAQIQDGRQPEHGLIAPAPIPDDLRRAFDSLHLAYTAPLCVAEASYRILSMVYHPDKGGTAEDMQTLTTAIRVLRFHLNPQEDPDDEIPF